MEGRDWQPEERVQAHQCRGGRRTPQPSRDWPRFRHRQILTAWRTCSVIAPPYPTSRFGAVIANVRCCHVPHNGLEERAWHQNGPGAFENLDKRTRLPNRDGKTENRRSGTQQSQSPLASRAAKMRLGLQEKPTVTVRKSRSRTFELSFSRSRFRRLWEGRDRSLTRRSKGSARSRYLWG